MMSNYNSRKSAVEMMRFIRHPKACNELLFVCLSLPNTRVIAMFTLV